MTWTVYTIYMYDNFDTETFEKANKDYFGENNADWLSEKNENVDRFEDDEGPKELDFDY